MRQRAYIALGANLEDPEAHVSAAIDALAKLPESTLVARSSLYRTAPVGLAAQPDFINAVAAVDTGIAPDDLLEALFAIERQFGRVRHEKNGPRTLDLDLLLYGDQVINTPHLHLPHPRLHLRAFVIVPLAEIAPDCRLPGRGTVAAWVPATANQGIARLP
ncbi:MAG: 2-amino-4-hydroxy-6-hydroxymethyldihydropteridine diphosphokinase [Zoogloeaceae bacterium]|nr:2-amino-4-hydroxy-6-hydroxymethyldihydropteridine diphosphokinase [Zoogloeaceae bacterium]